LHAQYLLDLASTIALVSRHTRRERRSAAHEQRTAACMNALFRKWQTKKAVGRSGEEKESDDDYDDGEEEVGEEGEGEPSGKKKEEAKKRAPSQPAKAAKGRIWPPTSLHVQARPHTFLWCLP